MTDIKESRERSFGVIEISEEIDLGGGARSSKTPMPIRVRVITWRPSARFSPYLPETFKLNLWCLTDAVGKRRFYPEKSAEAFLHWAILGGIGVLDALGMLSAPERVSYCAMQNMFRWSRGRSEFFENGFRYTQDLLVGLGSNASDKDILPDDVGLDPIGRGKKWTVDELIRHGRDAAHARGDTRPSQSLQIRLGLVEAARKRPLPIPNETSLLLLRSALFDLRKTNQESDPKIVERVTERIMKALHKHASDDGERFGRWFDGAKSNLVHQIAKQKKGPGGRVPEDEARSIFMNLGWQSYGYMSNCVQAMMRTVRNALPEQLSASEEVIFDHTFMPQGYLGGLCLPMISERFDVYSTILNELLHELPSLESVPIFHRLLDWYSIMATKRREADRDRKRVRREEFDDTKYAMPQKRQEVDEFAAFIRTRDNILCKCDPPSSAIWKAELSEEDTGEIALRNYCLECEVSETSMFSRGNFAELASPFF